MQRLFGEVGVTVGRVPDARRVPKFVGAQPIANPRNDRVRDQLAIIPLAVPVIEEAKIGRECFTMYRRSPVHVINPFPPVTLAERRTENENARIVRLHFELVPRGPAQPNNPDLVGLIKPDQVPVPNDQPRTGKHTLKIRKFAGNSIDLFLPGRRIDHCVSSTP